MSRQTQVSVSIAGAAALMHLPESSIREAIYQGDLSAMQFGRRLTVSPVDLELWAIGSRVFYAAPTTA